MIRNRMKASLTKQQHRYNTGQFLKTVFLPQRVGKIPKGGKEYMLRSIGFILFGYLSGSILYARIFEKVFKKENMIEQSKDQNPGTTNAFMYGGFRCGLLTLIFDLMKGFLPVFLFVRFGESDSGYYSLLPVVIAAPVIGHVFPVFYGFKGGKGIAVTFGTLAGLLPMWRPLVIFAGAFIFFSVVLRVTSHFYRTIIAYSGALAAMIFLSGSTAVWIGFCLISISVFVRMLCSKEKREKPEVKFLWMHWCFPVAQEADTIQPEKQLQKN